MENPVNRLAAMQTELMYQNLKQSSPTHSRTNQVQTVPPQSSVGLGFVPKPHAIQRSVFVMDADHTENQEIVESSPYTSQLPPPMHAGTTTSAIWNDDEKSILQDMEQRSAKLDGDKAASDGNPDEDLSLRVKQKMNMFSPDILHTEVTYPRWKSSEERASALLTRAFNPSLFPTMSQVIGEFAKQMRMSSGSADGLRRLSPGMFQSAQFRLSASPMPTGHFVMHQAQPPNAQLPSSLKPPQKPNSIQPVQLVRPIQQKMGVQLGRQSVSSGNAPEKRSSEGYRVSYHACKQCHKIKKRCLRPRPGVACIRCAKKKIFCEPWKDGRATNGRKRGWRKRRTTC